LLGLFSISALVALIQKVYTKAIFVPKMAPVILFFVLVEQNSMYEFTELAALGLKSVQAVQPLVYANLKNRSCTKIASNKNSKI